MPLGRLRRSRKRRRGTEVLCELVFRPLAHVVVLALLPFRVPPPAVVLFAAGVGLGAAFELARGEFIAAAALLQLKTVLDNADGQLARLSGRVTPLGRYLDAECDLLVNAALFVAIGAVAHQPLVAAVAFVVVTLVLGINFNAERLYRGERGDAVDPMPPGRGLARGLERIYGVVYAPQDRLVERFVEWRLAGADRARRLAYHDGWTVGVLANLGLSTQLAALGVCLAVGTPAAYLWLVLGCGLGVAGLAARRERALRRPAAATYVNELMTRGGTVQQKAAIAGHRADFVELQGVASPRHATHSPREIDPADWRRFERHVAEILAALGMDLDTSGTRDTPRRLLEALYDATVGYEGDPKLLTAFPAEHSPSAGAVPGQIVEGPIAFSSLCEHHALPFFGSAHVGYVAGDEIIGISKLTRLVRLFARRFTVQERLGEQIADTLVELIAPQGVAVHLEASHLCTRMRGVEEHSTTVTTFWRGAFLDPELRREFLQSVARPRG